METLIVALLIVAAIGVLLTSWLNGRRDRDPASSVNSFNRAMTAIHNSTPPAPGSDAADAADRGDTNQAVSGR